MRIFYIFNVNDYFSSMYKQSPYRIYEMLEDIYYLRNYDLKVSTRLYGQMVNKINRSMLNDFICNSYTNYNDYSKDGNCHVVVTNHEYSKLVVSNMHLKIKSNRNYPVFFETLDKYMKNIFICDFENKDYFWLDMISSNKNVESKKEVFVQNK